MTLNSREKGKTGELEAARELSRLFHVKVGRTQQYCGAAGDADVAGLPGVFIEVKRRERLSLYPTVETAATQAGDKIPLVLYRANRKPWLAIVPLERLPELVVQTYLVLAAT